MKAKNKKLLELVILLTLTVISFFLWNTFVMYPVKLLVVLLHEISHGLAAFATGGEIVEIQINKYLGGHCVSQGGNQFVIASAGYLGSLLWGVALFVSGYNKKWSLYFETSLSIFIVFIAANYIGLTNWYASGISLLFAIFFFLSPRFLPEVVNRYTVLFLGLTSSFYVAVDIGQDLVINTYMGSDAFFLSTITGIPAVIWGMVWLVISLLTIYKLFVYGYKKGVARI